MHYPHFKSMFKTTLLQLLLWNFLVWLTRAEESIEVLYHQSRKRWRNERSWEPWIVFSETLIAKLDRNEQNRLEIVGGFEEGILVIEKATVARGAGEDQLRDKALSVLYSGYGEALLILTPEECLQLALDPHTLLIGAETVSSEEVPSVHLCVENAENALRNSVTLDATNSQAEQLLIKVTGSDSIHKRKPKEFVVELFDSYAETFDKQLVDDLKYKVPQLVGQTASKFGNSFKAVLDAGCGTGLAGRFLRPLTNGSMVGVDASQKMLDIAARCTLTSGCGLEQEDNNPTNKKEALYDDLLAMDLEDMTLSNTLNRAEDAPVLAGFDLIVAADVLVYFGSLSTILSTFANISIPGAVLIFSCERATEEEAPLGWRLMTSGRFSHTKNHAVEVAKEAGYDLKTYEEIVPRMENGSEVKGHLFGFVLKGLDDEF